MSGALVYIPTSQADFKHVEALFRDYLTYLDGAVCGATEQQNLDPEFDQFPAYYDFLCLAKIGDKPVAACGVKKLEPGLCEIKRLFARPEGRGQNLGERLTVLAMEEARRRGFSQMYLHTDPALSHAVTLYQRLGFADTERYYDYPDGCSLYMKKTL